MNYIIKKYTELSPALLKEWEKVWETSNYGHIFNSPYWFQACLIASPGHQILILVCEDGNGRTAGILPLILDKKFGFTVYLSPGHKYLDKSTLLLINGEIEVFQSLIRELESHGSYYLTEIPEVLASGIKLDQLRVRVSQCSEGRNLVLGDDPLRYLGKENRRRLLKRIREDESIKYVNDHNNLSKNINIARSIEIDSSKAKAHKDIFSDPYLLAICQEIDRIKPGLISFDFLYQRELAICYKYGFITHGIYHYSNTAYREVYQKLSPGRVLMILVIRELLQLGVKHVDFSRGETSFKREFTDSVYRQYTLYHQQNKLAMYIWQFMYYLKELINL